MATRNYTAKKFQQGLGTPVVDTLAAETALKITVNGAVFTITMCTPGQEEALIRGLLYAEDVYRNMQENPLIETEATNDYGEVTAVRVSFNPELAGTGTAGTRQLLSVSSCGICGNTSLTKLIPGVSMDHKTQPIEPTRVENMFAQMQQQQNTFRQSGGSHAAAAFTADGQMLAIHEDIGRHNAVDKVIGQMIIDGNLTHAYTLIVSGRISYEIVSKAYVAGVPILAAVSAPSSLAVDYARSLNLSLLAFCRTDKFTIYAGYQRIINN